MTDEQINMAIAESLGWEDVGGFYPHLLGTKPRFDKTGKIDARFVDQVVPNYCNDLNAMHEAEKTLSPSLAVNFIEHLKVVQQPRWWKTEHIQAWMCIHAPARERAEAYLRTIGKWERSIYRNEATHDEKRVYRPRGLWFPKYTKHLT